ncbi:MAG: RtcB family protein [Chloroflexota bacterium]
MPDLVNGNELIAFGWKPGPMIGRIKRAAVELHLPREEFLATLDALRADPEVYLSHPVLGAIARELTVAAKYLPEKPVLHARPVPYQTWGAAQIDSGARAQMDNAMRLPVSAAGALMPDAHQGYGLPIGGVLATEGCVIPYAIGVDIACRMRLSIYDAAPEKLDEFRTEYRESILGNTHFGAGVESPADVVHQVLDDPAWKETPLLRSLHSTAIRQIGTSGSGNHFCEWGSITIAERDDVLGLNPGKYIALLTHSGSRGVGFKIANAFSKIAGALHPLLDESVKHLAWLPLEHEEGAKYWLSMELAGRFASANHQVIHQRVAAALGLTELTHVENHHNFGWRKVVEGREVIVHRKGATPAERDVLGVIPGSMADPGYVVRGKGNAASLDSASHGAGRRMSRRASMRTIAVEDWQAYLQERGIELLGGGIDESPQSYKRIQDVIADQSDLVDTIGEFMPRIVRMA